MYPSYKRVLETKKRMYPEVDISEGKCEVPLQNLLDKTCGSIVDLVSSNYQDAPEKTFTLFCKWGFDGSSGYSTYNQKFVTEGLKDDSLFVTSLVPLRLVGKNSGEIIWKVPRPSSTSFCRPIRIQWIHETEELCKIEEDYINAQIDKLKPFSSSIGSIDFSLTLTMVDGKVCNALAGSSTMRCYICQEPISQMNKIKSVCDVKERAEMFRFGLSVLHAYIRFFEAFLHISYRLEIKSWKVTKDKKALVEQRKKAIQDKFKHKMGLIVDIPKPGFGTSNNGNTARRFFANPKLAAEVTEIDEELIRRCSVILKTLNCGYDIKVSEFRQYCLTTAERYVQLYDWYYMPISMHKILIHGWSVIKESLLPIGELSEEAQEAKNKDIRYFREHHTRKNSRVETNTDLFLRMILSSDPKFF